MKVSLNKSNRIKECRHCGAEIPRNTECVQFNTEYRLKNIYNFFICVKCAEELANSILEFKWRDLE